MTQAWTLRDKSSKRFLYPTDDYAGDFWRHSKVPFSYARKPGKNVIKSASLWLSSRSGAKVELIEIQYTVIEK